MHNALCLSYKKNTQIWWNLHRARFNLCIDRYSYSSPDIASIFTLVIASIYKPDIAPVYEPPVAIIYTQVAPHIIIPIIAAVYDPGIAPFSILVIALL